MYGDEYSDFPYDTEIDHISAGAGYDSVEVGACEETFIVADDVDLGSGGGALRLLGGGTHPDADLGGGPDGKGTLRLYCNGAGPWKVDNTDPAAATATDEDGSSGDGYAWHDFLAFDLQLDGLTFRGSDRPEQLETYGALDVDLGGGADQLAGRSRHPPREPRRCAAAVGATP